MASVLPFLALVAFGVVDFARAFYAYVAVASAAHEAAVYLAEYVSSSPSASTLEGVAATESQIASTSFLKFGASGDTTLTTPAVVASTTNPNYVRVELRYQFQLLSGMPFSGMSGKIPLVVSAVAPRPGLTT